MAFIFCLPFLLSSCKETKSPNQYMVDLLQESKIAFYNPENPFSPEAVVKYTDSVIQNSSDENLKTKALTRKAHALLELGEEQKAIDIYQKLLQKTEGDIVQRQSFLKELAICYLRLGERMNCINMHNAQSCIYPITISGYPSLLKSSTIFPPAWHLKFKPRLAATSVKGFMICIESSLCTFNKYWGGTLCG